MQRQVSIQREIVQMRELGEKIRDYVLKEGLPKLPVEVLRTGADTTQSPNFRFLKPEEIKYFAGNPFSGASADETWIRVMRGRGVTILPIISFGGKEYPVLIFKPQPSVESWSIELPSGGVMGTNSPEEAARMELQQETGLIAKKMTPIPQLAGVWHAPHRLNTTDTMFIAEGITFAGKTSTEKEEAPISPFIASWEEVKVYLNHNLIRYGSSIATLTTYLLFHAPEKMIKELRRG